MAATYTSGVLRGLKGIAVIRVGVERGLKKKNIPLSLRPLHTPYDDYQQTRYSFTPIALLWACHPGLYTPL